MNKSIRKVPCCGAGRRMLLCAFILMVSFAAIPAYAAVGAIFNSGGVDYKVLTEASMTGTVEVTNNQGYVGANLSIPATVTDNGIIYDVVSISNGAFLWCTGITGTLTLPSVTSIGNDAFNACTGISGVLNLPSVTSIGNDAFNACTGISGVLNLPSVTSIGGGAFEGTGISGELNLPAVRSIGSSAFVGCTGISGVTFPSVTSIGAWAFSSTGISGTLTIPPSATFVDGYAFYNTDISTLYWPASLSILSSTFEDCSSLKAIHIIGGNAPSVGSNAFLNIAATGTLHYPVGAQGYTAAAFGLPAGWTLASGCTLIVATSEEGRVTGTASGNYNSGTPVALTAVPDHGYQFAGWTITGLAPGNEWANPLTFLMPSDVGAVTVRANFIPLPPPPPIMRPVTLRLPAGITSLPPAGMYYLQSGNNFEFTLTLPSGQVPTVKTDREIQGTPEVLTALPNDDGTYTFIVRQIRQMLEITVTSGVGNADVATSEVWSHGGKLYVRTAKSYTLYIYTLAGQLYKQQSVDVGETVIELPQGFYIVVMDGKQWKITP